MDDATWLAAELDTDDVTACRAAIDRKRRQAEDRGRPWVNVRHMVRSHIQLDEWREAVEHTPKPPQRRRTLAQCPDSKCPGPHPWEDARNRYHCQGA